ncbi:MGMT family protein [Pleionea sp. CnH1-48]|uniref:MGMT family protein n=1 Tax=Pleionea sp. CnH1-48 TaxID=2954494 RepID=UPI002096A065|nr:MGMT family protein [Pleionea sp. CnH1-48]MCO7225060.1 MGMT family protein [Pleionea sp. CnH1-48]
MKQKHESIIKTIAHIPEGKVASYGQIADLAGLPGRARLVGKVLKETDVVLPWHRILRSSGELAFPRYSEMATKQKRLLEKEGVVVNKTRVRLADFQWQPSMADMIFLLEG